MMTTIANPIYDIVFKYLLEDERVTKTILSALLQKEVVEVEQRRNEYTNIARDGLSVFRIDFGAKVREKDGSLNLVLIELQKTWLPTETLRFRQYLGAQYANPDNMQKEGNGTYAIPMVTVYLLGHKVGDIEEPVLYVRRQSFDYDGNLVTMGLPNPFVDSLTHESIIVQIPRLRVRPGNRLEKVLSVFDQTRLEGRNQQMLKLDESEYEGDAEMLRIVHRLTAAAADAKLRHEMNVEDEYFSIIEDRDTELMAKKKELAETKATLNETQASLSETQASLSETQASLNETQASLSETQASLSETKATLNETQVSLSETQASLNETQASLSETTASLNETKATLAEKEEQLCRSVRALLGSGMDEETVAATLGMSADDVRRLEALT